MSNSDEVDQFLQRMRTMSEQRDQQDAERVKKLEEELIQGRSERLARRAERARSLSPDKPSTPQSLRSAVDTPRSVQEKAADTPTPAMEPPSRQDANDDSLQRLTGSPAQLLEDTEPKKPAPSAAALGRSGTLSWQRRPQSSSIRRPFSMAAPSSRDNSEPPSPERAPSRDQIAQSLGAKDPSWFKQTPDRGIGSAAYMRNQEDNASETGSASGKRQLPGLSRESTAEPEATSPPPESVRSSSSLRGSAALSLRFSNTPATAGAEIDATGKAKSPLPVLESQKFAPPSEQSASVDGGDRTGSIRGLAMSPTQGRISPERPSSPTKGMGGFVQSAMLKRSDSVSKRWSSQAPTSLSRQNSTLSNRGNTYGTLPKTDSRPSSLSRDNSMEPSSRPGSSSSNLTITKDITKDTADSAPKAEFVKPALPHHSRSKSVASTFSEGNHQQEDTSPPSPSKRWSPTKSSWLESALNKPESPKLKQPPPQQPAWMSEINRIKQQRGSVDLGKGNPLHSPPAESAASGRSSPIKDIQLKPVGLRRSESPKKEEFPEPEKITKTVEPSPKPKPVVSPKPTVVATKEASPPAAEPSIPKADTETPTDISHDPIPKPLSPTSKPRKETSSSAPALAETPKPLSSATRFPKDSPLSSPASKPKPDTPPKKDFRANLKSRNAMSDAPKSDNVSELQSVFGKLKKTETKNYVAPDVLKDNILRGKQGLNITGGPKPSVRRDEFRDSLISKKAAMLAKAQEEGSAAHKRTDSSPKPSATPEALAIRKNLGRADSFSKPAPPKDQDATPEAIARLKSIRTSKPVVADKPGQSTASLPYGEPPRNIKPAVTEKPEQPVAPLSFKEPVKASKLANRFNPALANMLARGPPPMATNPGASSGSTESSGKPAEEEKPRPAPELTHMTKGRARGPKRRTPATKQTTTKTEHVPQEVIPEKVNPIATVPLVKAEHMLPSSEPSKTNEEPPVTRTPLRESLKEKPVMPAKSPDLSRKLEKSPSPELPKKPTSLDLNRRVSSDAHATPKKSPLTKPFETPKRLLPPTAEKPEQSPLPVVDASRKSPSPNASTPPTIGRVTSFPTSRPLPVPPTKPEPQALKEISAPNVDTPSSRQSPPPEKSTFSVKGATSLWSRQSTPSSPAPARVKSPIKLPTKADEEAAMENAGLVRSDESTEKAHPKPQAPKPKPVGLGLGGFGSLGGLGGLVAAKSRESSPPKPYSAKHSPLSPPMSNDRPYSEPFKASPAPDKPQGIFAEFFDEVPVTTGELPDNIDAVQILKNPPFDFGPSGKIRTLRKQLHEITGDGKLIPVPAHEEHVLFQECMYLCTHIFGDSKGARMTEVYLWSGNGVAEPTLEDVQLFARNYAKQNQGKLSTMRQGKETPNFFEALGGIVITRRGTNPPPKEYVLCGRRHLGHIAFDEVDFSLKSLCSGFAYIISTESGRVYLWKGKGCSAEELSGARLMGMDLTPTGEFLEVDEGAEPQELFNIFPPTEGKGPTIPRSADHWRYKAKADRYRVRLFKMEQQQTSGWGSLQVSAYFPALLRRPSWQFSGDKTAERPQTPSTPKSPAVTTKVVEIMPFSQRDLEPEHIYVLDAYFEMYIIVGALSKSQAAAFSTALMFVQEYSILAVSEEDRPFMPVSTVVLEGWPRDMKAVFRFWDDAMVPAAGLMRGKLGRGKSLRIVGLEKAIEATRN
ncbi:hypothetical protein K458DRAFT_443314 [Lentithecium fluviatile CBS 122367]|uniref:Uncharacterized protein n=1 Tax=Lentithecium fluviatile CBS 122367 TaxID=1168545 RepID=A0A6G1J0T5_9PLEO|nr:hypothetical protein K458DRAFT_443314 [Lentithecium fluviatile CBS 122367]